MAVCPECGIELKEGATFCGKCGATINSEKVEAPIQPQMNQVAAENPVFVESDEKTVSSIGNGVLKNLVTGGGLSSLNATLTDKRIYVSGKCLEHSGIGWRYSKVSRIIEVDEVSGTGFVYITKPFLMFMTILMFLGGIISTLVCLSVQQNADPMYVQNTYGNYIIPVAFFIVAIIFFIAHFLTKKNIFQIEYAGGKIGFDVKWIRADVATDFQKQIHLVKKLKKEADRITN